LGELESLTDSWN